MYGLALVIFSATLIYCCFFYTTTHAQLSHWYLSLNSCFYHSATWGHDFFTPAVKSTGNVYCIIASIVSLIGILYTISRLRKKPPTPGALHCTLSLSDAGYSITLIGITVTLWYWGNAQALPAFDEVFSAQHIAGIHPFQTVSYYMQPNNHLFFNLINNLVFHTAVDKVITGRIISLAAYCGNALLLYFAVKALFQSGWFSFLAAIALCTQFFVWGFSFQARAYELYLLAEWGMVISLFAYLHTPRRHWLYINLICAVTGYFCLPSFLYMHAAQLLFLAMYSITTRKLQAEMWKFQAFIFALSFICYLPTLSFSGIASITDNAYVAPSKFKTASVFWANMWPMLKAYLSHIFSDLRFGSFNPTLLLLALPISMIAAAKKDRTFKMVGIFCLCLWLTFFITANAMKRIPFERNLIGHYNFALFGVLALAYWVFRAVAEKLKMVRLIAFPLIALGLSAHALFSYHRLLKDTLYEYNVTEAYQFHKDRLSIIPPGNSVGFSDAEFYSYYLCRINGCTVNKCPDGSEQFYVTQDNEGYPHWLKTNYTIIHKIYNYEIYRHN